MAKTPLDKLDAAINKIMTEYSEEVTRSVDSAAKEVAQAGVKALRAAARADFRGSGKYAKGWKVTAEGDYLHTSYILHNASLPGLPHLLEYGHAKQNGGRVPGRVHIKPVEEKIIADFEKLIEKSL